VREKAVKLLCVDDEPDITAALAEGLAQPGLEVLQCNDAGESVHIVQREHPGIVVLDKNMPKMDGMEVLSRIREIDPVIDVYLLTGNYSIESAVEAIKLGAADYLTKPVSFSTLLARIEKSLESIHQRRHTLELELELLKSLQFLGMVGRSPKMLELFSFLRRIAPHYRSLLVMGETGTGKELVARALHSLSPVATGPFVPCNCGGIVETLAESQLFGYVKGAFTGAVQDTVGIFETASKGVVFLDEVGEMPLSIQAKLLRVLQTQEVQRVGSPVARKVDVRIIAATNKNLREMVATGAFREDLYYRLSMLELSLPPLRERMEDIPLLQRHFVQQFAKSFNKPITGISRRAQNALARHFWPGNVRELENVIGHACMMTEGDVIDIDQLPDSVRESAVDPVKVGLCTLEELERNYVRRVLGEVGGNKQRAAEILGVSRSTLYNLLERQPS
jgi:DNA-binding NtrC family response regulator